MLLTFEGDFGTMIMGDEPTRSGEYKEPIKPDAVGRHLVTFTISLMLRGYILGDSERYR